MRKSKFNILHFLQFVFIVFSAVLIGYMLDFFQSESFQLTNRILFHENLKPYLITICILILLYMGLYGLFNRFFYATAVYYVFFSIYIVANKLKIQYRSEPILPSDLSFLGNTKSLLSMVTPKLLIIVGIILILGIAICIILEKMFADKLLQFKPFPRVAFVLLVIFSIGSFYNINKEGSVMNRFMSAAGYTNFKPIIYQAAVMNGPLLTFLGNMHIDVMDKPSDYNQATMQRLVEKYRKEAQRINRGRLNDNLSDQTLIFILSESFADPSRVPNLKVSQEVAPNIMKIKKDNTSGLMMSSGYGGGTANMEYMTFTGLAFNQFSRSLQSPYTQVVTKQEHPTNIIDSFKKSAAIHPYMSSFYDLQKVYPKLGFQSFRNIDTTGKLALKYTDKIGNSMYASDESSYKDTLWQINRVKGGQFIGLVTMQNHMPYTTIYPHNNFIVTSKASSDPQQVVNYSKGLNYTDNSTLKFLNKLDELQKPVTVVWYGDHLPGIYDNNSMNKYNIEQHETDYFIYSNKYAISHGYGTKKLRKSTKVTDPNGFIPLALKQMKQKVTPYYALLTKVQEDIPAMSKNSVGKDENLYVDEQGKQVLSKDLTHRQKQLIHEYKLVQYDLTVGNGYSKKTINNIGN